MCKTPLQDLIDQAAPSRELIENTARRMADVPGAEAPQRAKVRRIHPERPEKRRLPRLRPALALSLALAVLIGGVAVYGRFLAARPDDHIQPLAAEQTALPQSGGTRPSTPAEPSPTGEVQASATAKQTSVGEDAPSQTDAALIGGTEGFSRTENGLTLSIERFSASGAQLACDYTVSSGRDEMVYYLVEGLIEPSAAVDFDYGHPLSGSASGPFVFLNNFLFIDLCALAPGDGPHEDGFQYAYAGALPDVPATLRLTVRAFVFTQEAEGGVGASDLFADAYSGDMLPSFEGARDGASFTRTLVAPAYVEALSRLREEEPEPSFQEELGLYLRALTESGLFYAIDGPTLELPIGPQEQSETVSVAEKSYFLGERFVVVHSLEVSRYSLRMRYDVHTKIPYDTATDRNSLFPFYYPLTPEGEPLYMDHLRYGWGASRSDKGYISFENSSIDRALDLEAIPEYLVFVPLDAEKIDQEKASALTEQGLSKAEETRALLRDIAREYPAECFVVPLTGENAPSLPEGWPCVLSTISEPTSVSLQRDYHAMFGSTLSEPRERLVIQDQWYETAEERVWIEEMQADDFGVRGVMHICTRRPYDEQAGRQELGSYRPFTPDGQLVGQRMSLQASYETRQEEDGASRVVVTFNIDHPFEELPDSLIFVPCPRAASQLIPEDTPAEEMETALAAALWQVWETAPEQCFVVPVGQDHSLDHIVQFTLERDPEEPGALHVSAHLTAEAAPELFVLTETEMHRGADERRSMYDWRLTGIRKEGTVLDGSLGLLGNTPANGPTDVRVTLYVYAFTGEESELDALPEPLGEDRAGARLLVTRGGETAILSAPEYLEAVERIRNSEPGRDQYAACREALTESGLFVEIDRRTLLATIQS